MRVRAGALLAATLAAAGVALVLTTPLAMAEISGPCSASINGESVAGRSTGATGNPITVNEHATAGVSMSSAREISHLRVGIAFGGFSWSVHNEATTGTSWEKSVNVDHYAKYGVGLYEVSGTSTGPGLACTGAALVKVEGNPLSTVAGEVGLGMAAVGAAGIAGAAFATGREGGKARRSVEQWTTDQLENLANQDEAPPPSDYEPFLYGAPFDPWFPFCLVAAIPALFLTFLAFLSNAGDATPPPPAPPAPRAAVKLRRVRWHPRISLGSLGSGLLAGLGAGVLLQEYAIVYPTRTVAIVELAAGLAVGLVLPSLTRAFAVRRVNSTIAASEARLNAARGA